MSGDALEDSQATDERLSIEVDEASTPDTVIFRLKGRLDVFTYMELKKSMEPLLAAAAGKWWLVDLSLVPFVASSGWSVFIATRARLKAVGAKLGLLGLAPELVRVYQSMAMGSLVPAFGNLPEAVRQMGLLS